MIVTCPEPGRLRAWLDGEAGRDATPLANHVAGCPTCRALARDLTHDAAVAAQALGALDVPPIDGADTERALARLHRLAGRRDAPDVVALAGSADAVRPILARAAVDAPIPGEATAGRPGTKESRPMPIAQRFARWRLALGGLAAGLALTLLVVTPEGQAAASGFLAQFRTQRFAVVTFDSSSADRLGLQRLERLGTLTRTGGAQVARGSQSGQEVRTIEEASRRVGFAVKQPDPAALPAGVARTPKITAAPAGETRFTFDREKAAAYFRDLGRADLRLPDRLHGTTLVISTPPMAMLQYAAADGKPAVMVGQTSDVQVSVEGGATLEEVREYLLSVPGGMPAELSRQLRALDRWESTLPIPVPVGKIAWRETTIHGGQGLVLTDNTGLGSAALWRQPDGRIVGVAGPLKGDELQRVVDSIR
ncbi:MAG: hypothetical protein M3O34_19205 [Chloroflexota bacterium]|nr:hypothetical protein [Chloroflexota bacterium]